jgi:hypothetical protein
MKKKIDIEIIESFGKVMSPILLDVEAAIADYTTQVGTKPNYDKYALRSATNIFISVLMDRVWELQEKEEMDLDTRTKMAVKCGEEVKKIVKVYTDIDMESYVEPVTEL